MLIDSKKSIENLSSVETIAIIEMAEKIEEANEKARWENISFFERRIRPIIKKIAEWFCILGFAFFAVKPFMVDKQDIDWKFQNYKKQLAIANAISTNNALYNKCAKNEQSLINSSATSKQKEGTFLYQMRCGDFASNISTSLYQVDLYFKLDNNRKQKVNEEKNEIMKKRAFDNDTSVFLNGLVSLDLDPQIKETKEKLKIK